MHNRLRNNWLLPRRAARCGAALHVVLQRHDDVHLVHAPLLQQGQRARVHTPLLQLRISAAVHARLLQRWCGTAVYIQLLHGHRIAAVCEWLRPVRFLEVPALHID